MRLIAGLLPALLWLGLLLCPLLAMLALAFGLDAALFGGQVLVAQWRLIAVTRWSVPCRWRSTSPSGYAVSSDYSTSTPACCEIPSWGGVTSQFDAVIGRLFDQATGRRKPIQRGVQAADLADDE